MESSGGGFRAAILFLTMRWTRFIEPLIDWSMYASRSPACLISSMLSGWNSEIRASVAGLLSFQVRESSSMTF
jgi:hypothetical protein